MNISPLRLLKFFGSAERYSEKPNNRGYHSAERTRDSCVVSSCKTLERILTENIIPFWYPEVIDDQDGGYRLNHDLEGRYQGRANKCLVTQARTVWFFSRLGISRYAAPEHIAAARHGYQFLRDSMWDKQFGGFYWEVDSSGHTPIKTDKHLYGQAFGLYAISEYAQASEDSSAVALGRELFRLFEIYGHDQQHGGYHEFFRRDWGPSPGDRIGYLGSPAGVKLMNTHLHVLEALDRYYPVTKDSLAKERLIEMILVNSNAVVRKNIGACSDEYAKDWRPLRRPDCDRVSYGHNLENVWLLARACKNAGIPNSVLMDLYRTIFDYSLRYGFDRNRGGFYDSGPFGAPADRRDKIWWVQAEALVAALQMYRLTADEGYWNCFHQTLDWIVNNQTDWEHGDWYDRIATDGTRAGMKAGPWKAAYHNGRAMLECLELLACA
jgi:cellobiose epimerase